MHALVDEVGRCQYCNTELHFQWRHTGFNDTGYMYCDQDSTVVTWSTFDPIYRSLVPRTQPWALNADEKRRVEEAVVDCPHGGRFRFDALPRCPRCGIELPALAGDPIYFVILADRLDGEKQQLVWRDGTQR
jgi:hypothetical protein